MIYSLFTLNAFKVLIVDLRGSKQSSNGEGGEVGTIFRWSSYLLCLEMTLISLVQAFPYVGHIPVAEKMSPQIDRDQNWVNSTLQTSWSQLWNLYIFLLCKYKFFFISIQYNSNTTWKVLFYGIVLTPKVPYKNYV